MSNEKNEIDKIVTPHHYTQYTIEPIQVILDWNLPYCVSAAIKYLSRYQFKDGKQDLKKAIDYLKFELLRLAKIDRLISQLETLQTHTYQYHYNTVMKDWKPVLNINDAFYYLWSSRENDLSRVENIQSAIQDIELELARMETTP